jgi:hypothetical protein
VWLVWPPSLVESCCSESQAGRWLTLPRSQVPAGARNPPFCRRSDFSLLYGGACAGAGKDGLRASYRPALAPPLSACLRKVLQQPTSVVPCYAIRVARAKKASRFHAIGPSVAGLETLDFEHLSTWQDAVCQALRQLLVVPPALLAVHSARA